METLAPARGTVPFSTLTITLEVLPYAILTISTLGQGALQMATQALARGALPGLFLPGRVF